MPHEDPVLQALERLRQDAEQDRPPAERLQVLDDAAQACYDIFQQTGRRDALDQAIAFWQQARAASPPGSESLARYLNNLGAVTRERFLRTGEPADLEEARRYCTELIPILSPGHSLLPGALINLGNVFLHEYQLGGDPAQLGEAVGAYRRAVEQGEAHASPHLPFLRNSLGTGLWEQYRRSRDLAVLEQAIACFRRAIQDSPADSPYLEMYLHNLGNTLRNRAGRTGQLEDLHEAIAAYDRAVACTPSGSPALGRNLNGLACGLFQRYLRSGQLADLERALQAAGQAVEVTPPRSPERPQFLNTLGVLYDALHQRTAVSSYLERAVAAREEAVALLSPSSPLRGEFLSSLATGLQELHERTGVAGYLQRAVQLMEEAAHHVLPGSPDRPGFLANFSNLLLRLFHRHGDAAHLEAAIQAAEEAVALAQADTALLPPCAIALGNALRARHDHAGAAADLDAGRAAFDLAIRQGADWAPLEALRAATTWGTWAEQRQAWDEAAAAYERADQAGLRLLEMQLLRDDREQALHHTRGVSSSWAYALARLGRLPEAVEVSEAGRARLLSDALERNRADLERLNELGHADLYQRYRQAAGHWRQVTGAERTPFGETPSSMRPAAAWQATPEQAEAARQETEATIAAIREVPGYEDFLRPMDFAAIQAAVEGDPVVFLSSNSSGGLALVVPPAPAPVRAVWLPGLTRSALLEEMSGPADSPHLEGYLGAYLAWRKAPRNPAARDAWFAALDRTTRWLWDVLMGPLLADLAGAAGVTLIPADALGQLPLHAAWTEDSTTLTKRRYALDVLTIRYAPNVRALASARAIAAATPPDALLAVDNPQPVQAEPLRYSRFEVDAAAGTFPRRRILPHETAGRDEVLKALPEYPVFHFSCHGSADFTIPLRGGLLLAGDRILSLRHLLDLRLKGARLAVLSACETGFPGFRLLDEVVSLPTGFLQAGVAGVTASLWPVAEVSTMMLMVRFYDLWRTGSGPEPAEALRQAQQWLRDTTNREKRDYFAGRGLELSASRQPSALAEAVSQYLKLAGARDDPSHKHPFHWGAFTFVGV